MRSPLFRKSRKIQIKFDQKLEDEDLDLDLESKVQNLKWFSRKFCCGNRAEVIFDYHTLSGNIRQYSVNTKNSQIQIWIYPWDPV